MDIRGDRQTHKTSKYRWVRRKIIQNYGDTEFPEWKRIAVLYGILKEDLTEMVTCEQRSEGSVDSTLHMCGERTFWAEETVRAKALRKEMLVMFYKKRKEDSVSTVEWMKVRGWDMRSERCVWLLSTRPWILKSKKQASTLLIFILSLALTTAPGP